MTLFFIPNLVAQERDSENCHLFVNETNVWGVDSKDGEWYLIRGSKINQKKKDEKSLIKAWNTNSDIKIVYEKSIWNTVFIKIPDSWELTQSKGSTGALLIIACIVYTLTENPQYKHVYLDFVAGEHGAPGIYSRRDFEEEFNICF